MYARLGQLKNDMNAGRLDIGIDDADAIAGVCNDVVEFGQNNERHFVYAIQHAGAHPAPEPGVDPTPYSGRAEV